MWHITCCHATLVNTHKKSKMQTQQFFLIKIFSLLFCELTFLQDILSSGVFRQLSLFWLISKVTLLLEFDTFYSLHIAPSIAALFTSPLLILLSQTELLDLLKISHLLVTCVCTELSMEPPALIWGMHFSTRTTDSEETWGPDLGLGSWELGCMFRHW